MRVVIIGGTGHVGTYLVPKLVEAGHEVISVSRQSQNPYQGHAYWESVEQVKIDRKSAEQAGSFGQQIRQMDPDVVIDMICFTPESVRQLVEALRGQVQHFLLCGTIHVYGHSITVPTTEDHRRQSSSEYGINKAAIEAYLLAETQRNGFPATVLHPGNIIGPGWSPVNPAGNFDHGVFDKLSKGQEVLLPNQGMETVHHVHADDLAQAFMLAMTNRSVAIGESFNVVSKAALTLRGYAEEMARWFGQPANLQFANWEQWRKTTSQEHADITWTIITHSASYSIEKAQRLLDFQPRYSSLQAVQETVAALIKADKNWMNSERIR